MATTSNITSAFVGKEAGPIISVSFKDASTIDKGLITVLTNIAHGKGYIRRIQGANGLQNYACQFTPTGSLTLDEKVLEPKKLMINQEFCKEDFRNLFDSYTMGYSAWNKDLPTDEKAAIMDRILNELAVSIDTNIWSGSSATAGQFDGLINQLEADSAVIDIDAVSAITAANVVAELSKVFAAIPAEIYGKDDLVMVASSDVFRAYVASQANLGFGFQYNNQNNQIVYFNGVELHLVDTLPAKTVVAYRKSNFFMGTALEADFNEVRLLDMSETTGDDTVRVIVKFAADTNYGFGGEVVLYNPA